MQMTDDLGQGADLGRENGAKARKLQGCDPKVEANYAARLDRQHREILTGDPSLICSV
jgi:hypothetical protein